MHSFPTTHFNVHMFTVLMHMFIILYTASSTSILPGQPSSDITPGTGPIFVPSLQCPSDASLSENPYVKCLNELILGQTECSHDEDIGIVCEGM